MENICVHCQSRLTEQADQFFCPQCETGYHKQARCPQCGLPPEVLKACGAVDYFCRRHGLLSKSQILFSAGAEK